MKKILITFLATISLCIGVSFIYQNFINFENNISFYDYNSTNIFPDSEKLNKNIIIFKDSNTINTFKYINNINLFKKDYKIKSNCKITSKYIWNKNNFYFFKLTMLDNKCNNSNFILNNWQNDLNNTKFKLNIIKLSNYIITNTNYSNKKLKDIYIKNNNEIKKLSNFQNITKYSLNNIKKNRIYTESIYKKKYIKQIIHNRKKKYNNPVIWYKIATELNIIPNAGRPYRNSYTDGIHHWWDIIAPFGTTVSAIDSWVIIRVVNNFNFDDLKQIKKDWYISKIQKLKNLDTLRWNQVWLKTNKWDVIFYSHLSKIYEGIKEWNYIESWFDIWEIWKSWVPDKNYTNFHLHFPIMKNPYDDDNIRKYSYTDIMDWDWYLKWLEAEDVLIQQKDIFVNEAFLKTINKSKYEKKEKNWMRNN